MDTLMGLLLDWHVAIVLLVLLFLFPLIFALSSTDRTPVRIKRVEVRKKSAKKKDAAGSAATHKETREEQEDRERLERRERARERQERDARKERAAQAQSGDRPQGDNPD